MIVIAFDTVFEQCSVAVLVDGQVSHIQTVVGSRGQTELILPMLDEALMTTGIDLADVKGWAFNRGPGAFSGIRINTAVVQALSATNDAPCVGVSSLEVLAYAVQTQQAFCDGTTISAVMDARQNQVYAGSFIIQGTKVVPNPTQEQTDHEYLADYHSHIPADVVVGSGAELIQTCATKFACTPNAGHIGKLAHAILLAQGGVSAERALPVYLRNNAWKTLLEQGKKPQQGL